MDLQEAGSQALERCKELITHAEDAANRVEAIDEDVERIRQQLDTDWKQATEKAQALLTKIKQERQDLEEQANSNKNLLTQLHQQMTESENQMLQSLQQFLGTVNEFGQAVGQQQPVLEEALTQVHEKGRALKAKSDEVHGNLESAAQDTEKHLSDDVSSAVGEIEQAQTQRVEQLDEHVQNTSMPEAEQHYQQLHSQIDDYKSAYEESVNTSHDKTQKTANDSVQQASEKHTDVFQQFQQIGNEAKQLMETLKTGIDAGAMTIGAVQQAVSAGVNTTSIGIRAAIGTLEELMEFFQKFSFIKF